MPDQEKSIGKKRGRPPIGPGLQINTMFRPETVAALDRWIAAQPDPKPTRPEAIRRLIEFGLRAAQGAAEKPAKAQAR